MHIKACINSVREGRNGLFRSISYARLRTEAENNTVHLHMAGQAVHMTANVRLCASHITHSVVEAVIFHTRGTTYRNEESVR